ncbi:dysbindin domain-containing protein 1-like, partial [Clarias magur]
SAFFSSSCRLVISQKACRRWRKQRRVFHCNNPVGVDAHFHHLLFALVFTHTYRTHVAAVDGSSGPLVYWMEAQGGTRSPDETKTGQKLLKPSTSGEVSKEPSHHSQGEEDRVIPGHTPSLLHVTDRRQPLSSVSSLEVHFDLLDLTELTDMSDQELAEVFLDSDEENPESPS